MWCRKPAPLSFKKDRFLLRADSRSRANTLFTAWYRRQARVLLEKRVPELASHYNLTYSRVRISSARTRWASCSSNGTLSFTWRLVMAPQPVIDYIIIHELAHLLERNHSSRYWATVQAMLPDYRRYVKWLKQNGHLLTLE